MDILGIHEGHNNSAALMRDGEIIAAASEERYTRGKNDLGFPTNAIAYCLDSAKIRGRDLDFVALTTKDFTPYDTKIKLETTYTIEDYLRHQREYWDLKLSDKPYPKDFLKRISKEDKFNHKHPYDWSFLDKTDDTDELCKLFLKERIKTTEKFLSIPKEKIKVIDHHDAHSSYAYFGSPFRGKDTIIISIDSFGDGINLRVSKVVDDKITTLTETDQADLGRFYKYATLYLGMKPNEHEYKVMGLAAYAKEEYTKKVYDKIKNFFKIENMKILHKNRPADLYEFMRREFEGDRFDNVAGAIQLLLENTMVSLVKNIIKTTGIRRIVISGGVSLNVKMNKRIGEIDEVKELYVCGGGSDESLCVGGCYKLLYDLNNENRKFMKPINTLCLGNSYTESYIKDFILKKNLDSKYEVIRNINAPQVAKLLSKGEIIARLAGRMEFGPRALGNRSILCDPSRPQLIRVINDAIKGRDFWMPFACSILEEDAEKYLINPKGFKSYFMAISFDTKEETRNEIIAGIHPYDFTVRPQIVRKSENQKYYEIIKEFKEITSIGVILNTSFNLHGEPIVNSPEDALYVFENSGLKNLLLENTLIKKEES